MNSNEKKRHHYIPVSYLSAFTDERGRVFAYRKDEPAKALYVQPSEIGFQRYYYSQPKPDGGQDNNQLENFFSTIETRWPGIVAKCERRESLSPNDVELLFQFIAMLRIRVPAARDGIESMLAAQVRQVGKIMEARGELPKPPPDLAEYLRMDNLAISIDPHRSIHAMADLAKGFAHIADAIGLDVLHLPSGETLITSDNPVVYFDPAVREDHLLPYTVRPPRGSIELLFPMTPTMLLRGHTETKARFGRSGVFHKDVQSKEYVKRANRLVARFGYHLLIANSSRHAPLILKYAHLSPVLETRFVKAENGTLMINQNVFGERKKKPKWTRRSD